MTRSGPTLSPSSASSELSPSIRRRAWPAAIRTKGVDMPKLSERIDMTSWQVVLLPMPKGKKYGIGLGFCDGLPVGYITGAGYSARPQVWMDAKPVALSFQDLKKLSVSGARGKYIVGSWMNTKGEPHALCWHRQPDGSFNGVELHPPTWEQSSA